jgi:transcriptional regulatory protein LEU3
LIVSYWNQTNKARLAALLTFSRRLEELEDEAKELKRQLTSVSSGQAPITPITPISIRAPTSMTYSVPPDGTSQKQNELPESRSIDGLDISPAIIEDCFHQFFTHYDPRLPILDSDRSPNWWYNHSSLVFWLIVSIGSRRYAKFPTLTNALSSRVTNLALSSLNSRYKPLEVIRGLVLLLTWPFPSTAFYRDSTCVLSGALLHLAMQCGLHTPFIKMHSFKENAMLDSNPSTRAQLWAYVVIAYQKVCTTSGHPVMASIDIYTEEAQLKQAMEGWNPSLKLQLQIATIMARAQRTFLELGLLEANTQQDRTLDSLIRNFTSQLNNLKPSNPSVWDLLNLAIARQELAAMHFFKTQSSLDVQCCNNIFETASSVTETLISLEKTHDVSQFGSRAHIFAALMGISLILRILKGPLADYFDQQRGSNLYHGITKILKASKLEEGDLSDKTAMFAAQIWSSIIVFKEHDGTVNTSLLVRNRLTSSILHDTIQRWRAEFFGNRDPLAPFVPESSQYRTPYIFIGFDIFLASSVSTSEPVSMDVTTMPSNLARTSSPFQPVLMDDLWQDLGLGLDINWGVPGVGWQ